VLLDWCLTRRCKTTPFRAQPEHVLPSTPTTTVCKSVDRRLLAAAGALWTNQRSDPIARRHAGAGRVAKKLNDSSRPTSTTIPMRPEGDGDLAGRAGQPAGGLMLMASAA